MDKTDVEKFIQKMMELLCQQNGIEADVSVEELERKEA